MLETLQNIVVYGGSFVLVLSLVVFVHEFGHFQAARWSKVAIETFSIGFGKTLLGWKDRQGVQWKIGALPLGGYVKFADDADPMSTKPAEEILDPAARAEARRRGLFHAQPIRSRAFVVAAGPLTNFIFAIAAFAALIMIVGRDVASVNAVMPESAAAAAGLQAGDIVREVDGEPVPTFRDLQQIVMASPGEQLLLTVERGESELTLPITPSARTVGEGANARQVGMLGVEHAPAALEDRERVGPLGAISFGAQQTWQIIYLTGSYVADIFSGRQSADQLAGPLGILDQSGKIATAAIEQPDEPVMTIVFELLLSLLEWAAILSVAVGIVNLLPIPILDGGHLLFYAIEAVRGGKPLPLIAQEWAFRAGIAVMGALFLFATWNDIQRHLS